jgi:hypothetical protein
MEGMPAGYSYDLDPLTVPAEQLQQNQANIEMITKSFLDIIGSSVKTLPS